MVLFKLINLAKQPLSIGRERLVYVNRCIRAIKPSERR